MNFVNFVLKSALHQIRVSFITIKRLNFQNKNANILVRWLRIYLVQNVIFIPECYVNDIQDHYACRRDY